MPSTSGVPSSTSSMAVAFDILSRYLCRTAAAVTGRGTPRRDPGVCPGRPSHVRLRGPVPRRTLERVRAPRPSTMSASTSATDANINSGGCEAGPVASRDQWHMVFLIRDNRAPSAARPLPGVRGRPVPPGGVQAGTALMADGSACGPYVSIRFRLAVATRLKANPLAVDTPVMVLIARDLGEGGCVLNGPVLVLSPRASCCPRSTTSSAEACCCADTFSDRSVHSAASCPHSRRSLTTRAQGQAWIL
jgi:hypothetical protein